MIQKWIILIAFVLSGLRGESDTLVITITINDVPLAVEENIVPTEFHTYSAFPNPFNNVVLLKWDIPNETNFSVSIFDVLGRQVWFENWGTLSNATLKVISPDGTVSTFMSERGTPRVSLRDLKSVEDGVYKYDLSAATDEVIKVDTELNNGRGKAQRDTMFKPFSMGGIFFVTRGAISQKELLLEE